MIDSERFKLLYGPYVPPKCQVGDKLRCEHRDREVTVSAISDTPIRWPCAWGRGPRSPILCGELIRAVRLESAIAVAHHWGVNRATVSLWRRELKVARMTLGSIRLRIDYSTEILTPEVRAMAAEARKSPEVRARLGRPRRSNMIAVQHKAAPRPRSDRSKRRMSEAMRKAWEHRKAHDLPLGHGWTKEEIALLGTAIDREVGRKLGQTEVAVRAKREYVGIPPFFARWTEEEISRLGVDTDRAIAEALGRTAYSVPNQRGDRGIPVCRWPGPGPGDTEGKEG